MSNDIAKDLLSQISTKLKNDLEKKFINKIKSSISQVWKLNLDECRELKKLMTYPIELLEQKNLDITVYFAKIIEKRQEKDDLLFQIVDKFDVSPDYRKLNQYVSEWRNTIKEIGNYINIEIKKAIFELNTKINKIKLNNNKQKEAQETWSIDNLLKNI